MNELSSSVNSQHRQQLPPLQQHRPPTARGYMQGLSFDARVRLSFAVPPVLSPTDISGRAAACSSRRTDSRRRCRSSAGRFVFRTTIHQNDGERHVNLSNGLQGGSGQTRGDVSANQRHSQVRAAGPTSRPIARTVCEEGGGVAGHACRRSTNGRRDERWVYVALQCKQSYGRATAAVVRRVIGPEIFY
jgi:hypothetical protein